MRLAKNNPKKSSVNFGSKKIITIPMKDVKIRNHLFLLIFSFKINALARIPNGIASWDPKIIGDIIEE
tara:strand:+ start:416 stop:619 length:204 start_codon:yes stop_codon:yes gene_type:complete